MNEKDRVEEIFIEEIDDDPFIVPCNQCIVGALIIAIALIIFGMLSLIAFCCKIKTLIIIMIIINALSILLGISFMLVVIEAIWNNKHN